MEQSELDKEFLKNCNPRAWESLVRCLADFETEVNDSEWGTMYSVAYEKSIEPLSYMIFLTLVILLDFRYWGREEKVAWTIPFNYKGEGFVISLRKFGLRIFAIDESHATGDLGKEMVKRLHSATKITDRLIEPTIKKQVEQGNVTLQNRFHLYYDKYMFFRDKAAATFESKFSPPRDRSQDINETPVQVSYSPFRYLREGFFYTQAMLDAYFSYLEHVLVLLLPFSDFDPEQDDLISLMSSDWKEKFNRIFKPTEDPRMMRCFSDLQKVKEKYRNTFAHGGYEKKGASLHVHFPEVGALPISLSQFKNSVNFSTFPVQENEFENICKLIDGFEEILKEHPFARPMEILRSGLNVCFHTEGIENYRAAVESDESLNEFLEYESYVQEKIDNMDW